MPTEALNQILEALDWAMQGWQTANQPGQLAQVFAFRAVLISMNGQLDEALSWAKQALEGLPKAEQPWRGMVLNVFGIYELHKGQIDRAKYYLNEARINTDAIGNHNFMRANMSLLAWAYSDQGELNQSAEYLKLVLADAYEQDDKDDIIHSKLGQAELFYEWDDLEAAWQAAQAVLDLIPPTHNNFDRIQANAIQARILHVRGQTVQALQRLNSELSMITVPESSFDYQYYREVKLWQARFYLDSGNLTGFEHWANTINVRETTSAGHPQEVYPVQQLKEAVLTARWLTSRGEWEKAMALLEPLLSQMQETSRFRYAMKARLSLALALAAGKQLPEARRQLQIVLSQAHIEGFMRLFLDEGEPMANLLKATPLPIATAGKAVSQYRQKILQASEEIHALSSNATLAEPLSPQEQRVLALLGAGLSYPQIAGQLVVFG